MASIFNYNIYIETVVLYLLIKRGENRISNPPMHHHVFTFNPFGENTYLVWDDAGTTAVIDPGMYGPTEEEAFDAFVQANKLQLAAHWLTHAHVDHVFGCSHIHKRYGLLPQLHPDDRRLYEGFESTARLIGIEPYHLLPDADYSFADDQELSLGALRFRVMTAPGHAPGHVVFWHEATHELFSGDVLFTGSIGRTDLPGGDMATLMNSIQQRLLPLPDDTRVYAGHMHPTTIGQERAHNPFILQHLQANASA